MFRLAQSASDMSASFTYLASTSAAMEASSLLRPRLSQRLHDLYAVLLLLFCLRHLCCSLLWSRLGCRFQDCR